MLAPDDRTLLVDLLAPPEPGYELRAAVATTFTLDLTTLLGIPLRFAGMELGESDNAELPVLSAVERYADRLDVFCQAGNVFVPAGDASLLSFLESSVHQVKAPPGGLFHPKLWVLRYMGESDDEIFRLICGSRNLTNDRSWDTAIALEGRRSGRRQGVNRPLTEFLLSLPDRVSTGIAEERRGRIEDLAEALRYVKWEAPGGAIHDREWLRFHVFSSRTRKRPSMSGYRRLIVSPYVNDDGLREFWPDGSGECHLVSRPEELNRLDGPVRDRMVVAGSIANVLNDAMALHDLDSDEHGFRHELSGLHSKFYVVERESRAHVFVGSANASDQAWRRNDEILVEIIGRKKDLGVAAAVGENGLGSLIEPHLFGDPTAPSEEDELRYRLEDYLRDLSARPWIARISGADPDYTCALEAKGSLRDLPEGAHRHILTLVPLTRSDVQIVTPGSEPALTWSELAMTEVTPFFVARLSDGRGMTVETVFLAKLEGDLLERRSRILAEQFADSNKFLQFVMMLLQLSSDDEFALGGSVGVGAWSEGAFGAGEVEGLLESTLNALCDSPLAVDEIEKVVEQLERTARGRDLLPKDWGVFWAAVLEAREVIGVVGE